MSDNYNDDVKSTKLGFAMNKPNILKEGELDWWLDVHTTWIQQMDYQCWNIIALGDEFVLEITDRKLMDADYYQKLEKNAKARQLIFVGLQRCDIDKVKSLKTAKEIWEAIITIHRGSEDNKNNRKFNLQQEFHAFKQLENEPVNLCQSRFLVLIDKLNASGVVIPQWEQSLTVIHAMSEKFDLTRRIALMTEDSKKLPVRDIFGKFYDQEIEDNKVLLEKKAVKGTALKLTRALQKIEDEEGDEDEDLEVALMTKVVKKFFKNKNSRLASTSKRELKDYTCYNCQEKGYIAKKCTNPKVEQPEKKALVSSAAWGDDDDTSTFHEGFKGLCLMAKPEDTTDIQVAPTSSFLQKLAILGKDDLIIMIKGLLEDNEFLEKQATEYDTEVKDLRDECEDLSNRLAEKGKALKRAIETTLVTKACEGCKGKQPSIASVSDESPINSKHSLDLILTKITNLTELIDKKMVNQTVFVKEKIGLGYNPDGSQAKGNLSHEKLNQELSLKAETLDKALQACKSRNEFLEEKVKALEKPD